VDDQQTQRVAQAPMTDDEIQSRIDALIAELRPAEKAGQLSQYFYFGSVPETDAEQISHRRAFGAGGDGRGGPQARRGWITPLCY
jgi:beta-glucosidase